MERIESLAVGDQVEFFHDDGLYTVQASNDRFSIMTCGEWYTIIDWNKRIRGPNNLCFNLYEYSEQEGVDDCMADLMNPDENVEVSRRNSIDLDIVRLVSRSVHS